MDAKTLDTLARYHLPYPISRLYVTTHGAHRPGVRLSMSFSLTEGIVRYLGLSSLALAMHTPGGLGMSEKWLDMLRAPGIGKLLALLVSTSKHLAEAGIPFLQEVREIARPGSQWLAAANSLRDLRNEIAHDDVPISDDEARDLLGKVNPLLAQLLSDIRFLQDYQLGTARDLTAGNEGYHYYWYAGRGNEEFTDHVKLTGGESVRAGFACLLHVPSDSLLYLAPFMCFGTPTGTRGGHFLWLHSLTSDTDVEAQADYRHPVSGLRVIGRLPRPDDPSRFELPVSSLREVAAEYPAVTTLRLAENSKTLLARPPEVLPGDKRYTVLGKIGEGGWGTVWHVHDNRLGRPCAMKVLHAHCLNDPKALERFLREANVLAKITHPRVVQVFDVETPSDSPPRLLMEYVDGEDLETTVLRDGPLSTEKAVEILLQVLEGLDAIHSSGVVHRDIKPANVMLSAKGVRLLDFGVSVSTESIRLTRTSEGLGTPAYMAPEQWRGETSPRVDVYAAGQLLFFMLRGEHPPMTGGASLDDAPPIIQAIYDRATQPAANDRYPTVLEFKEDLEAALEDATDIQDAPGTSAFSAGVSHGSVSAITPGSQPCDIDLTGRPGDTAIDVTPGTGMRRHFWGGFLGHGIRWLVFIPTGFLLIILVEFIATLALVWLCGKSLRGVIRDGVVFTAGVPVIAIFGGAYWWGLNFVLGQMCPRPRLGTVIFGTLYYAWMLVSAAKWLLSSLGADTIVYMLLIKVIFLLVAAHAFSLNYNLAPNPRS